MNKIFQIGFNKCGTYSIYNLFRRYTIEKLPSLHWEKGLLAKLMIYNLQNNKPIIPEIYSNYTVFTDMEGIFVEKQKIHIVHFYEYFEILDQQYPGSKFILNTRNFDKWMTSRLNHKNNSILIGNKNIETKKLISYWKIYNKIYKNLNQKSIIELWKQQWYTHHNNVINYFSHRPQDLLIYNIDTDKTLDKFKNFFPNLNFTINALPLVNKTKI